jgi:hypothetical protein
MKLGTVPLETTLIINPSVGIKSACVPKGPVSRDKAFGAWSSLLLFIEFRGAECAEQCLHALCTLLWRFAYEQR